VELRDEVHIVRWHETGSSADLGDSSKYSKELVFED
jgi:hypothetical protein